MSSETKNSQQSLNILSQMDAEVQNDFDPYKLLIVFKRSIPAMILILVLAIAGVFLFLRYAKPIYQSSVVFKLQPDNRSNSLGFSALTAESDDAAELSGEIEIIRSPVVRDKVCAHLNLSVSYFTYGNILYEEQFNLSPFKIEYTESSKLLFDTPIDIQFLNKEKFQIEIKEKDFVQEFTVGQLCKTPYGDFTVTRTQHFENSDLSNKMFITFNSPAMLNRYFQENLFADVSNNFAKTIVVSFKDHNAEKAYEIVKSIDSIYLDQTLKLKLKSFDQAIDFLNESIDNAESKLVTAENEFESFMRRSKTMDVRADYAMYTLQEGEIEQQKIELKLQLSLLNDLNDIVIKDENLEDFIPSLPKIEDVQLVSAIGVLNQLNQEKEKLSLSQNQNTHAYKTKEATVKNTKEGVLSLIDQNKKIVQKQIHELSRQDYEIESSKLTLPAKETEMSRLKRHYNLYDKFYVLLMEKRVEHSIAKAAITNNFLELSKPYVDNVPIYPKRKILFVFAIGLGVLICICLII
ncbi:MAG: hypothetical protein H7259_04880, partial [Cytophagales bacterium]|nr:hypothetical protein [Cytophaga sp.]